MMTETLGGNYEKKEHESAIGSPESYGIVGYDQIYVDQKFSEWKGKDASYIKKDLRSLKYDNPNKVKMIQYRLSKDGYDLSYPGMRKGSRGIDADPGKRTYAAIDLELLSFSYAEVNNQHKLYEKTQEDLDGLDVYINAMLEDVKYTVQQNYAVHSLDYVDMLHTEKAKEIGLSLEVKDTIDKSFTSILSGRYNHLKIPMMEFVKTCNVPEHEIPRLCKLWKGENALLEDDRDYYTVVGQVGKEAWIDGFKKLGMQVPTYKHDDHYNAMIASYGYAKRSGIFKAKNKFDLGVALVKYNLGSYKKSSLTQLFNQAPELRKQVVIAAGLDERKYDRDTIKMYVEKDIITRRDTAIGAQRYYMPDGIA